ncbi:MAG: hypothetical protein WD118_01125 [Phycisphaeraceae bacterium]
MYNMLSRRRTLTLPPVLVKMLVRVGVCPPLRRLWWRRLWPLPPLPSPDNPFTLSRDNDVQEEHAGDAWRDEVIFGTKQAPGREVA